MLYINLENDDLRRINNPDGSWIYTLTTWIDTDGDVLIELDAPLNIPFSFHVPGDLTSNVDLMLDSDLCVDGNVKGKDFIVEFGGIEVDGDFEAANVQCETLIVAGSVNANDIECTSGNADIRADVNASSISADNVFVGGDCACEYINADKIVAVEGNVNCAFAVEADRMISIGGFLYCKDHIRVVSQSDGRIGRIICAELRGLSDNNIEGRLLIASNS